MVALSLVLGGTAVAASTAKHGDKKADTKLIKKLAPSLSVKHAKTANSANSATNATNAVNATHATTAGSATTATNATNASELGGQPASNFLTTASRIGTDGIVKESASASGNTVTLFTVGPFTVKMTCTNTGTGPALTIEATSSEANSVLNGQLVTTANTPTDVGPDIGASTTFQEANDVNDDFEAPSGAQGILVGAEGTNSLGTDCWANWIGFH